ncbi:uncharacterized protein MONBRDRAFT_28824 [Monosiga brevicollis MX1]|uniref:BZIP domain-containing protein n=1 Tax=Monosiga brevicollis TaxID=81824 RepID=A9V9J2_MONBE|nr:uncharacterized protein MONBRDRAFT_28824 [Monosiga brevicollis MX1]EDQ85873.1 predicted protein [Monosiga brevicollis MX1]|eukprot:XP_001749352.1 hypothetical protein [Monosiga brevicollis MX1]
MDHSHTAALTQPGCEAAVTPPQEAGPLPLPQPQAEKDLTVTPTIPSPAPPSASTTTLVPQTSWPEFSAPRPLPDLQSSAQQALQAQHQLQPSLAQNRRVVEQLQQLQALQQQQRHVHAPTSPGPPWPHNQQLQHLQHMRLLHEQQLQQQLQPPGQQPWQPLGPPPAARDNQALPLLPWTALLARPSPSPALHSPFVTAPGAGLTTSMGPTFFPHPDQAFQAWMARTREAEQPVLLQQTQGPTTPDPRQPTFYYPHSDVNPPIPTMVRLGDIIKLLNCSGGRNASQNSTADTRQQRQQQQQQQQHLDVTHPEMGPGGDPISSSSTDQLLLNSDGRPERASFATTDSLSSAGAESQSQTTYHKIPQMSAMDVLGSRSSGGTEDTAIREERGQGSIASDSRDRGLPPNWEYLCDSPALSREAQEHQVEERKIRNRRAAERYRHKQRREKDLMKDKLLQQAEQVNLRACVWSTPAVSARTCVPRVSHGRMQLRRAQGYIQQLQVENLQLRTALMTQAEGAGPLLSSPTTTAGSGLTPLPKVVSKCSASRPQ